MNSSATNKKDKVISAKGDEASEIVLSYLTSQNRPYGATDLSANVKNRVTKSQAAKTLSLLHERGEIMGKSYGKTTVYCALQKDDDALGIEEMEKLEEAVKLLVGAQGELRERLRGLAAKKTTLANESRTEELSSRINDAVTRSALVRSRISNSSAAPCVTQESLNALNLAYNSTLVTLGARRKVAKELEGLLCDLFDVRRGEEGGVWERVGGDAEVREEDARVWSAVDEMA